MPYQSSNVTAVTDFIIIGFPGLQPGYFGLMSVFLLFVYMTILGGNCFILIVVVTERSLQKPTYILFCNLAISDLIFATTTLPKVIARYWADDKIISFPACFLQMFVVHLLGCFDTQLLMIMALDRYVAICNPLRYKILINNSTILTLCGLSGLISSIWMIITITHTLSLPYCNSNVIVQCYCDHFAITSLACENVKEIQVINFSVAVFILLGAVIFIVFSYTSIIISVLKTTSLDKRYKLMSTCTPQLFIMCVYYIPRGFVFLANTINLKFSTDLRILLIMLYSFLPPMVNPVIYCFKTKEIKDTLIIRLKIRKVGTVASLN